MRQWSFLLIALLFLTGCQPAHITKINNIRERQIGSIEKEISAAGFRLGAQAYIRIFKEEAILETWLQNLETGRYELFKTYPVCTFSGLLGPKFQEGDKQSPEGFYDVVEDRLWPGSKYHLAMNIGFPNEYDQYHGRNGSYLMIHGGCESEGCYAMTDEVIEKVYLIVEQAIKNGQESVPVHIFPFRMTKKNMALWNNYEWTPFWKNLKQGYDLFEINRIPPHPTVRDGKYAFYDYYVPRKSRGFVNKFKGLKPTNN